MRALRHLLWLILKHRFQSVPQRIENDMVLTTGPEKLLAAFKKALTIEKIEDLRI